MISLKMHWNANYSPLLYLELSLSLHVFTFLSHTYANPLRPTLTSTEEATYAEQPQRQTSQSALTPQTCIYFLLFFFASFGVLVLHRKKWTSRVNEDKICRQMVCWKASGRWSSRMCSEYKMGLICPDHKMYVVLPGLQHLKTKKQNIYHKPLNRASLTFTSYTGTKLVYFICFHQLCYLCNAKGDNKKRKKVKSSSTEQN